MDDGQIGGITEPNWEPGGTKAVIEEKKNTGHYKLRNSRLRRTGKKAVRGGSEREGHDRQQGSTREKFGG